MQVLGCYILGFQEIDQTQVAVVDGKGAHLGELSRFAAHGWQVTAVDFSAAALAHGRSMAEAAGADVDAVIRARRI